MRSLTPACRRAAALGGAAAALSASIIPLAHSHESDSAHIVGGFVIGLALTLAVGALVKLRTGCARG